MSNELLPVLGDGWVHLLARLAMGGLLAAAGLAKFRHPERLEASVEQMGLGGGGRLSSLLAAAAIRGTPATEAALGVLLLLGCGTRFAAAGAAALMAVFAVAVAAALPRRVPVDLNCGPGLSCRVSGWTVLRNAALSALALLPLAAPADAVSLDHLLFGVPAAPLAPADAVPALGLALFVVAVGRLVPAAGSLVASQRRASQGHAS